MKFLPTSSAHFSEDSLTTAETSGLLGSTHTGPLPSGFVWGQVSCRAGGCAKEAGEQLMVPVDGRDEGQTLGHVLSFINASFQ